MADPNHPSHSGYSECNQAAGHYPKRIAQYDEPMHGSLDHRRLKRSQSAINSSQLLREDEIGAGQLVKVDISRSNSEYASVAQTVRSPTNTDSNPSSPGVMSSFRPSDSAKLYASPEEIKSVGYRNPQMLAQLNRMQNSNYATTAKSRSQSLPPTTQRPPVSRLMSDSNAASTINNPVPPPVNAYDDGDDDDLPLPPPPPEEDLITYAKPQNNRGVHDSNNLMTSSCIVNKSDLPCSPERQMSVSYSGPSSSQSQNNDGEYSSEEESTYNSQYDDDHSSRTIKRKKQTVAFAPNLVKSSISKDTPHYAAPIMTTSTPAPSSSSPLKSTIAASSPGSQNFSDLIAKKAEERRARLETGGNASAPTSATSSPSRKPMANKPAKGLSDAILESALFNKQKERVSNGSHPSKNDVLPKNPGQVSSILQKMKNSKSCPSEFPVEDGENSSSGVSSDHEVQSDGTFVTVINTESNLISESKAKTLIAKANSVEECSVSSESSEDASDRTWILSNDKSEKSSKDGISAGPVKRFGPRTRNASPFSTKLSPPKEIPEKFTSGIPVKKNGPSVALKSNNSKGEYRTPSSILPATHPLATSQPLPGHLQGAIHPSNTHVGQAKFSTLQRPHTSSKKFTKASSDPPAGVNHSGGGTLIRSRSINREELNLNSGSATLDRNFHQANKSGNASGKGTGYDERSIDESLQLIRMHMNSLNEVNTLAGIKASHPINESLRESNALPPRSNKSGRTEEVLAPPPQFSDMSALNRSKAAVMREADEVPDHAIRIFKRSNRRVEEEFKSGSEDTRGFMYKALDEWSTRDTTDWLESLFMPEYKDSFENKQIDGAKLIKINNESLINLGVRRVGHRVNMEKSLKRYRPIERIDL